MNIVKGFSIMGIVAVATIFVGLTTIVLHNYFGSWVAYLPPITATFVLIYIIADLAKRNHPTLEQQLKEQGHSPETITSVKRGLEQSAKGNLHDLGPFTQYTEEKDD